MKQTIKNQGLEAKYGTQTYAVQTLRERLVDSAGMVWEDDVRQQLAKVEAMTPSQFTAYQDNLMKKTAARMVAEVSAKAVR